jgi:glutathione S-transferase
MKLYISPLAPNPRRVTLFLAEKGIEVETISIDTYKGENLTADYLAKNMFGKVPVLEFDDGTCLSESVAICRYFEEVQPDPPLFGTTAIERATIEMWQRRVELYLTLVVSAALRNLTGFYKDREKIVKEWGEVSFERAETVYEKFDSHLATNRYFAGDEFSIADITCFCTIDFAGLIDLNIKDDQKNLARWFKEISSRPSVHV